MLLLLLLQVTAVFGKDPRSYGLMATEFIGDDDGNLRAVRTIDVELKDGSIQHVAAQSASGRPTWSSSPWGKRDRKVVRAVP